MNALNCRVQDFRVDYAHPARPSNKNLFIMKLRLPRQLMAAVVAAVSAVTFGTLATGTAAYGSTTYNDLTTKDYFEANENVYNTGKGTFYLKTTSCDLNLTLTLNLNKLNDFQTVHDYANGGYYSPFVTWTYNNNPGATYGMADVARGYSGVDYDSGFTGYWAGSPWTTGTKITTDTLWADYADTDGNVTLTINNTPNGTTNNVVVTATNKSGTVQTLYSANGLRSQNYTSQNITSFTVNMNYVTSVTLNTDSTLESSSFTPPKDYTIPFESERTDGTSVGRVLFMGDSITHGVQDMSYRWGLFKTFVDNGIENEIAGPLSGYHSDPLNSDYNGNYSSSQYGGETFDNAHYAQSSGRTHNMLTASGSVNALGNSTGVNYGGVSSAKVGKEYNADTYIMMMGTNDILSDGAYNDTNMPKVTERLLGVGEVQGGKWVNGDVVSALIGAQGTDPSTAAFSGKWGTMGQIIDNMKMGADDTMYIVSIPTWGEGRTGLNGAASYVAEYNVKLEKWVDAYNESESHTGTVKYVDVNRGLVNVTRNGQFLAPDAFFRTAGGDYIHPNEQGALIIAGNLAQGMGLAGRTAGLARSAAGHAGHGWQSAESTISLAADATVEAVTGTPFTADGGYTIDFSAVFGDGAANGWSDKSNALSISVGDGSNTGTLKLSEGYISWGDKLLFCQDNHLVSNDSLRIAFTQGNAEQNIGGGYYVWLGDMLIGQALTAGTGTLNGVTLSSLGGSATVKGLQYTNTAYAPSTTLITSYDNGRGDVLRPMGNHDNAAKVVGSDIDWSNAATSTIAKGVDNVSSFTDGKATVELTAVSGWFAAGAVTTTGNIEAKLSGKTTGNNGFAVQGGKLTGDVTMEITSSTVNEGGYATAGVTQKAALAGSYGGASVTGTFTAYINDSTLNGDMVGGTLHGTGSIGAVDFVVNNGEVNGTIYGGSKTAGTVGNGTADGEGNFSNTAVAITVNGGHVTGDVNGGGTAGIVKGNAEITINGGIIDGNITGGDIQGKSTVTVEGNKALIGGDIKADTVQLKSVAESGTSDGFDKYAGTITATNLVLDNYTAGKVNATLVTDYVTATNGTIATIHGLTLRNCSIDAKGATALTLGENIHSGNTISYSGNIRLEDGTSFTIDNPTAVAEGSEGFSDGVYIYKVSNGQTGSLQAADGTALTGTHTATFTGTDALAGKLFSYESSTGALIAHSNTATYNIVSSTVDYSGISSAAGVTMSGGQLNLDTALTGGTITATGGTVNIGEGVTLAAASVSSGSTVSLSGEGTFAIASSLNNTGATQSLPTGITFADDAWHGIVRVTGGTMNIGDTIQALTQGDSSVELSGVSGYLGTSATYSGNIILTNNGSTPAVNISASVSNQDTKLSGSISGDGDIIRTIGNGNTLSFTGDISGWTGTYYNGNVAGTANPGWNTLNFRSGETINANFVNNAITNNCYLTLNLNGDTVVNGTLSTKTQALNVNVGGTVTFNNSAAITSLSANGKSVTIGSNGATHGALTVSGTANIGKLTVQEGTTATFNGTNVTINAGGWDTVGIEAANGTIKFANGTNLRGAGSATIGTLIIGDASQGQGGTLTYAGTHNGDYAKEVTIHNLQSSAGASLHLVRDYQTQKNTTYVLGGSNSVAANNTFNGTIHFDTVVLGNGQAQLVLADTNIAANAQLTLNNTSSKTTYVGIAADTVKVQGIADAEGSTSLVKIYSGNTGNGTINGASDGRVRTLEITGSGEYSTAATLGANINILVSGTGTQTFTGDMSAFNGTFTTSQPGTVQLASGAANLGVITMHNSSATDASILRFSAKEGASNEYTFSTWTMSDNGDTGLKWMIVDKGVTVKGTGSNIGVGSVATINNGWGIAGGGLEVNGKLVTAGVISMDGPSSSTLKGTGTIQTTGLNVSNGNTVNVEGGVRIEVTSDKGIYKRAGGDSTLNLAEATLAATSTDWELKNNINYVNLTSADKGTTFDAAADRTITVSKAMGGAGALVKTGEGKLSLNAANSFSGGVTVKEGTLEMKNASALGSGSLTMEGGTLEVAQGVKASATAAADKDFKGSISVGANGALDVLHLSDTATAELVNLNLDTNAVFGVYTSVLASEENVAALSVSGTLTASAGSTLNADLVMQSGSTLHLAEGAALTMGCSVTLENGTKLELGGNPLDGPVSLYKDVESLTLGDTTYTYEQMGWYDAAGIITSLNGEALSGDYVIGYWNGTVSFAEKSVPEPATATLSLLALAALAARRKRK